MVMRHRPVDVRLHGGRALDLEFDFAQPSEIGPGVLRRIVACGGRTQPEAGQQQGHGGKTAAERKRSGHSFSPSDFTWTDLQPHAGSITCRCRREQAFPIVRAVTARLTPREVAGYHSEGRCGRACLVPTMCWRKISAGPASREETPWIDAVSWRAPSPPPPRWRPGPRMRRRSTPRAPSPSSTRFPPGGAVDVVARPLAAVLAPILKQPAVIETKAGAAGEVGAQFAAAPSPTATRC